MKFLNITKQVRIELPESNCRIKSTTSFKYFPAFLTLLRMFNIVEREWIFFSSFFNNSTRLSRSFIAFISKGMENTVRVPKIQQFYRISCTAIQNEHKIEEVLTKKLIQVNYCNSMSDGNFKTFVIQNFSESKKIQIDYRRCKACKSRATPVAVITGHRRHTHISQITAELTSGSTAINPFDTYHNCASSIIFIL